MKALIDGDVIVYVCGFASDKTMYTCPDGHQEQYKSNANAHCDAKGLDKTAITKAVTPEPVEHCLHSVKLFLKDIIKSVDGTSHKIFLTGKGNFRDELYGDYKANRDRSVKPLHYDAIREYLINVWHADEVVGVEADDALGWAQYKEIMSTKGSLEDSESCICTIDKDLNQIPGWHYNWKADGGMGTMYMTTPEESLLYFFTQWLVGDSADNIPGVPKVGYKTAQKILQPLVSSNSTVKEYYDCILNQYRKHGKDAEWVNMIGDLLWMQRNPSETWSTHLGIARQ